MFFPLLNKTDYTITKFYFLFNKSQIHSSPQVFFVSRTKYYRLIAGGFTGI